MNTTFLNEHILPGEIGHFLVLLAFVSSIVATIANFIATQSKLIANQVSWKKLGRASFQIHAFSIIGVFSILFYLIFNHYFEYYYVWSHSSKELPFKYLLSCFWEGQEGSFLLWSIWHSLLGLFVIYRKNKWESGVMTVISAVQIILSATLLGLYFFNEKIGSSPFFLLRDQMVNAPIFQQPNYLDFVKDGNGLNPLLQNYWMVIHPPILFLGFASTLLPFAYSLTAMWKNDYEELSPSLLRWSGFSGMILGTGIMMGGAWAYESLNFGGYWAWDPVENASLVPWIIMVAGLHTTMIFKATGFSLKATLLFFIFSFILVLYSTFLTRTGILGETSVHSFTGEGSSLFYHLLIFIFLFLGLGLFLFFKKFNAIPDRKKEEEALSSREFWMFIGALVLMISVVQITYTTSMPVWNKIFNIKLAITDPVTHYNKIQLWITVFILLGMALMYYFKFKQSNMKEVLKKLMIPIAVSLVFTIIIAYLQDFTKIPFQLFLFTAVFSVVANVNYIITVLKTNAKKWGGTVAHIGFALMMLGILISGYNKRVISVNRLGVDILSNNKMKNFKQENQENVLLFKNISVRISDYDVMYLGDTIAEPNHYYKVQYQKRENDTGKVIEQFVLKPNAQINPKMGLVSSPDTRHYLTHDVFTYVTETVEKTKITDTTSYKFQKAKVGDSIFFANGYMIFKGFEANIENKYYKAMQGDVAVSAKIEVHDLSNNTQWIKPVYFIRNQTENTVEDTLKTLNLFAKVTKIFPEDGSALIEYKQPSNLNEYIIMKAILFPYINVLWIGTILMVIGFGISLYKRFTVNK